ncbi:MAG TPA: calcium-binding protein [Pirellulaceae bacterium]|nr:calcium-binding protein [Pirellulaceae bacterium]
MKGGDGDDTFLLDLNTADDLTNSVPGLTAVILMGDGGGDTFGQTPDNAPHQGSGLPALPIPPAALPAPILTPLPFPGIQRGKIRPSLTTSIVVHGGGADDPSNVASPVGNATAGNSYGVSFDLLNLDLTDRRPLSQSDDSLAVVATVSGAATFSDPDPGESFQSIQFASIEAVNVCDQGALTRTAMGDLYLRGTEAIDIVQLLPFSGIVYRARINAAFYMEPVTGRMIVYGRGGNDTIQQSNVSLPLEAFGEAGDDFIMGSGSSDLLVGGPGSDRLYGGEGNNELWGDNLGQADGPSGGNDQLTGGGGNETAYGGGGNDIIYLYGGNDYAFGGWGNDTIDGGLGDDRLFGGEGDDYILGNSGNDLLAGNAGNDRLYGQAGHDVLIGGLGADQLIGDSGNDLLVDGTIGYDPAGAMGPGSDASTFAGDASDVALLALLADWLDNFLLDSHDGLAITHDTDPDKLSGGLGFDTAAGLLPPDSGDWDFLLP